MNTKSLISNKEHKVARVKCLNDTLFFTRYGFKHRQNRKFVIGDHHQLICNALDRVFRGECKRLIINVAPRFGKTEIAVKCAIAKGLAHNPEAKFIHLSYSDSLALANSEEVRDMVQMRWYTDLFPDVQIKKDSNAKKKWDTTRGGGVYATSSNGQVTGFGAGRVDLQGDEMSDYEVSEEADSIDKILDQISKSKKFGGAIIIDDPLKPEDAMSEVRRNKVNARFDSTIRNRVNSRNTPIIIIMQRLHPEDLCGYVLANEPGEWEVLSLPSIKEDGTALWPFKHTIEELNRMWALNPQVFQSQHLQNPMPVEGLLYKTLREYQSLPPGEHQVKCVIDTADTGKDYLCAIAYIATRTAYYIVDVYYTQSGMETTEPETAAFLIRNSASFVKVESNNGGRGFMRAVERICREQGERACRFFGYTQTKNKQVRIYNAAATVQNMVFFPAGWATMWPKFYQAIKGHLAKGQNVHDDAADALTMITETEGVKKVGSRAA